MPDTNKGVNCDVSSCIHYVQGSKCSAATINVGDTTGSGNMVSQKAQASKDTCCDTFQEKKFY